jgi:hypothetical protein
MPLTLTLAHWVSTTVAQSLLVPHCEVEASVHSCTVCEHGEASYFLVVVQAGVRFEHSGTHLVYKRHRI